MLHPLALFLTVAQGARVDAPNEVMPERDWDLLHLTLNLEWLPESASLRGVASHRVKAIHPEAPLVLHQVELDIQAVTVNGQPTTKWHTGEDTLSIDLPEADIVYDVAITYAATPTRGLNVRDPAHGADRYYQVWSQGESEENRHWFPGWDTPNDRFTVEQIWTVPSGYQVYANGKNIDKTELKDGRTRWRYVLDQRVVNYLVSVALGDYRLVSDPVDPRIDYAVLPDTGAKTLDRTFGQTPQMMAFFEDLLGDYPFDHYRQVVAERFLYSGMENSTNTIIAEKLLLTDDDAPSAFTDVVVSHELAHQWFGDSLTCYGWRELWLNEGFASYYTSRWREHSAGPEEPFVWRWQAHQKALKGEKPMAARWWSKHKEDSSHSVYNRGMEALYGLDFLLGRPVFDQAIRRYVAQNTDSLVETDQLRRHLEDASGQHLGWYFDTFVFAAKLPTLTSNWSYSDGEVHLHLVQDPTSWSTLPLWVELGGASGAVRRKLTLSGPDSWHHWPAANPPEWIAVDPDGALLIHGDHQQSTAQWTHQLEHSPSVFAQLNAARALETDADDDSLDALKRLLADDARSDAFHEQLLASLAAIGTSKALALLEEQLDRSPTLVIESATQLKGAASADDVLAKRLLTRAKTEDSPYRRAALLAASGGQRLQLARAALKHPDDTVQQVVWTAALSVLGNSSSTADVTLMLRWSKPDKPEWARYQALIGLAKSYKTLDAIEKRRLQPAIDRHLSDTLVDAHANHSTAVLTALLQVGGERSLGPLRDWRSAHPERAERVDEVIQSIEQRTTP